MFPDNRSHKSPPFWGMGFSNSYASTADANLDGCKVVTLRCSVELRARTLELFFATATFYCLLNILMFSRLFLFLLCWLRPLAHSGAVKLVSVAEIKRSGKFCTFCGTFTPYTTGRPETQRGTGMIREEGADSAEYIGDGR